MPTYRNSPRTRHYGIEAGLDYRVPGTLLSRAGEGDRVRLRVAYTYARYRFVDDSSFGGHEFPAPPVTTSSRRRATRILRLSIMPTVEWVPESYFVNSSNTDRNLGWATLGVRAEWTWPTTGLSVFAAAQNLTDHVYSASVQVDNGAGVLRAGRPPVGVRRPPLRALRYT